MIRRATRSLAALAITGSLVALAVAGVDADDEPPAAAFDHSHAGLTLILDDVLQNGLVDYAALRESPAALDAYLAALEATSPGQQAKWTSNERFAFWINAYNAYTLKLIRDEGPVKSIKDLGGLFRSPWEKKFIPLNAFDPERKNKKITLDEIEHEILRPTFKDARVHAAVNCASLGCPPLRAEAFQGARLDAQLADQVAIWLRDTTRNQVRPVKGSVRISKIFDWFDDDFGKSDERILRWIADNLGDEQLGNSLRAQAGDLKIKYLSYDWKVNAPQGKR